MDFSVHNFWDMEYTTFEVMQNNTLVLKKGIKKVTSRLFEQHEDITEHIKMIKTSGYVRYFSWAIRDSHIRFPTER